MSIPAVQAWQEFADVHGFRVEDRSRMQPQGRVVGDVDDCPVRLEVLSVEDTRGTPQGHTKFSVWINGAPSRVSIERRSGVLPSLESFTHRLREATGECDEEEDAFHADHSVRGDDARRIIRWLTPSRRSVLRAFCSGDGYFVCESAVAWADPEMPTSVDRLEEIYRRLIESAHALNPFGWSRT